MPPILTPEMIQEIAAASFDRGYVQALMHVLYIGHAMITTYLLFQVRNLRKRFGE